MSNDTKARGRSPGSAASGHQREWRSASQPSTARRSSKRPCAIHGGYGYSQEYEIERLCRDAPLLLIGEGTAEIQKTIIGRRLLDQFKIALAGPQIGPGPAVITGG